MVGAMTEKEAKEKWCPHALSFGRLIQPSASGETVVGSGPQNRGYQMGGPLHNCMCIASACMAWRWNGQQTIVRNDVEPQEIFTTRFGYCGLAGAP
jgi:hypothetical protein